ncbi:hypothetical protein DFP73DRAFT_541893 [Morchella snyderi]|nr:hypothetical protein DFP73DRAFT_541893 [Morchella snyderi]
MGIGMGIGIVGTGYGRYGGINGILLFFSSSLLLFLLFLLSGMSSLLLCMIYTYTYT